MEKENVLEIEYQEVFGKTAVRIKYQNFEVLKRGEFYDKETRVDSACEPEYDKHDNKLYIQGKKEKEDNKIILVDKEDLKEILKRVNKINEKYGITKRWRAKITETYYCIDDFNGIYKEIESQLNSDNKRYKIGNYFKTKEEAEKVKVELDKFWEKVRAGEIGEEND